MMKCWILLLLLLSYTFAQFLIGTGIYDITGPAEGVALMGYAQMTQRTKGLYHRLFSRAFVFEDQQKKRVVFVVTDTGLVTQAVKLEVVKRLREKFGNMYSEHNVMITCQHTHSGPGGTSNYILYNIPNLGFEKHNFEQLVHGIVQSITIAQQNMRPGTIKFNRGKLYNANINRSPTSYLANPESERMQYPDGDTIKDHTILRFDDATGKEIGMISWFSVHATSVGNTNLLIHGDNKGYATFLFERLKNPDLPGKGPFVAAFAQLTSGDVSPNILGVFCPDGRPCANDTTCGGRSGLCHGKGPGKDMYESSEIIGRRQFESALKLYEEATTEIKGTIDFRHTFLNMHNITIDAQYTTTGKQEKTCPGALGFSFAAGTTDGPGGWFKQGLNDTGNPFVQWLLSLLNKPTKEQIECQKPKPVFLSVYSKAPYLWVADYLPLQLIKIGQFVIAGLPVEITTMAGRRLEKQLWKTLRAHNVIGDDGIVIIQSHANAYAQYLTTYEEYRHQRYEAASVLFGPHTLAAYTQELDKLAIAMGKGEPVPAGPRPANVSAYQRSFNPGVIVDPLPLGKKYGDIKTAPKSEYTRGTNVTVEFWGGNFRNNFLQGSSYLYVEKQVGSEWRVVVIDTSLESELHTYISWYGPLPCVVVKVVWHIPASAAPGVYRIRHVGYAKSNPIGNPSKYEGVTEPFVVN